MLWLIPALLTAIFSSALLALIYLFIYQQDKESFLLIWTISWTSYCLQLLLELFLIQYPAKALVLISSQFLSLLSGILLIWGTHIFADKKLAKIWRMVFIFGFLWILICVPFNFSFTLQTLPTFSILAVAYIWTGFNLLKANQFDRIRRLPALAFIIWGIHKAGYPFLRPFIWFTPWGYGLSSFLAIFIAITILLIYFQVTRSELLESKNRYKRLANNAPDILYRAQVYPNFHFEYISPALTKITGFTQEEFYNPEIINQIMPDSEDHLARAKVKLKNPGQKGPIIMRWKHKNGSDIFLEHHIVFIFDKKGEMTALEGIARDISERKATEIELQDSEEKYRLLVENAHEGIFVLQNNLFQFFNDKLLEIAGYSREEMGKIPFIYLVHPKDRDWVFDMHTKRIKGETQPTSYKFRIWDKNENIKWAEINLIMIEWEKKPAVLAFLNDIHEKEEAERALRREQERAQKYLDIAGVIILILDTQGNIKLINQRGVKISGYSEEELLGKNWLSLFFCEECRAPEKEKFDLLISGKIDIIENDEVRIHCKNNEEKVIGWSHMVLYDELGKINGTLSSGEDITQRKLAEMELIKSEQNLRTLIDQSPVGIITLDIDGFITDANPQGLSYIKSVIKTDKLLGQNIQEFPQLLETGFNEIFQKVVETSEPFEHEFWFKSIKGKELYFRAKIVPRYNLQGEKMGTILIFEDFTERKHSEFIQETVIQVSTELRKATTRSEMLPLIIQQVTNLIHADGATLALMDNEKEYLINEYSTGIWAPLLGTRLKNGEGLSAVVLENFETYISHTAQDDPRANRTNNIRMPMSVIGVPLATKTDVIGILWTGRDYEFYDYEVKILEAIGGLSANAIQRASLHEETQLRSQRLSTLREIDKAISNNFDLLPITNILTGFIIDQLKPDAVLLWSFDQESQQLKLLGGEGFKSNLKTSNLINLGQGFSGKAASDRSNLTIKDENEIKAYLSDDLGLKEDDGFIQYYAQPLIARNDLNGILEIYFKKIFYEDQEWIEFFETLSGQAAIAIDNTALFHDLQHSNTELSRAYDETLEGWARALEMRDMETHGHSDRVTDLTLLLAVKMKIKSNQLVHIRRGALLHDIGKMSIPDDILNKPGKLDDQEWNIMRQHPIYAHKMLSPIRYLHPALDIPYCHHEKWDGSGYPRGLKGMDIPLSARIFAVVDVWDALNSDRPYRKAWPQEKTLAYIKEESGKHFDPDVVDTFLKLIKNIY